MDTEIVFENCEYGIGIRIIGGFEYNDKFYQIFIREILQDGLAFIDGRLFEGDQLLAINDIPCTNLNRKNAIKLLRNSCGSGRVKLLIRKYSDDNVIEDDDFNDNYTFTRHEYDELVDLEKLLNIESDQEDDEEDDYEDENGHDDVDGGVDVDGNDEQNVHSQYDDDLYTELKSENVDGAETMDETILFDESKSIQFLTNQSEFQAVPQNHQFHLHQQQQSSNATANKSNTFLKPTTKHDATNSKSDLKSQSMNTLSDVDRKSETVNRFNYERDLLVDQLKQLQIQLAEKDKNCSVYKDELYLSQQKMCEYLNEIIELRSRLSLAEECQKESMKIEKEYKQIIKMLKNKLQATNSFIHGVTQLTQ